MRASPLHLLAVPLLTLGCLGQSEVFQVDGAEGRRPGVDADQDAQSPLPSSCVPGQVEPGELPLQRITRAQYNFLVEDLLGVTSRPADTFPAEEEVLGFDNIAVALQPSALLTEKLLEAAERVSNEADLAALLPCPLDTPQQDSCAADFIQAMGARAFRRPLAADEADRLRDVYLEGKTRHDFATGIRWTIQALLQSPYFLYRVEVGDPKVAGTIAPLSGLERASRLSFLLWMSAPDEALLEAANDGTLATAAGVEAQARRMLADPKARRSVAHFHDKWLGLSALHQTTKDPATYPSFSSLKPLFEEETERFLDYVFWESDGSAARLFDTEVTFVNETLATFYGLSGVTGAAFVEAPRPERRAGLLTQGHFLASHAKPNASSPVHRGVFVREKLLCDPLPPPPDDVPAVPEPDPSLTTRERFAVHSSDAACSGCHSLIDPIGFGFEGFDGLGAYRAEESGKPVDETGTLEGAGEAVDGDYVGAAALSAKLARSPVVMTCIATQWFRYGYGRLEQEGDACNQERILRTFEKTGYNLRELLVALTQTDAFLYRRRALVAASAPGGNP